MMDRGVVGRGLMDGGVVCRGLMDGGVVGSRLMVGGLALVLDIHHIAGVGIGSVVGHNLGAAIGEEDMVVTIGGVAIALLISTKLHIVAIAILGINTILVSIVGLSGFVLWLMVSTTVVRGRGVVNRGVVDGCMMRQSMVGNGHSGEGSNNNEALNREREREH